MNVDYDLVLFCALSITGIIALFDSMFLAKRRKRVQKTKMPLIIDYARSFFPIILLVFSFRSFAFEPRRIPSGSLKPTLLVGDFILVNKFAYGIRLPISHTKILNNSTPQRGDIVVFRRPTTPSLDLIKRVVGVPGDHISYINKVLYINGRKIAQQFKQMTIDRNDDAYTWQVEQKQENLLGLRHDIFLIPDSGSDNFYNVTVPEGKYFMMGDNRDDSADSRVWGFMPEENVIGKATHVIINFDKVSHPLRWNRLIKKII